MHHLFKTVGDSGYSVLNVLFAAYTVPYIYDASKLTERIIR